MKNEMRKVGLLAEQGEAGLAVVYTNPIQRSCVDLEGPAFDAYVKKYEPAYDDARAGRLPGVHSEALVYLPCRWGEIRPYDREHLVAYVPWAEPDARNGRPPIRVRHKRRWKAMVRIGTPVQNGVPVQDVRFRVSRFEEAARIMKPRRRRRGGVPALAGSRRRGWGDPLKGQVALASLGN